MGTRTAPNPRRIAPPLAAAAVAAALLLAGQACNAIFGADDLKVPPAGTGGQGACVPEQCPSTDCLAPACEGGECATVALDIGTPCTQSGGKVCNGVGACVECASDS